MSSQVNEEIGYASAPGALVIETRKSVSGAKCVRLRGGAHGLERGRDELRRRQFRISAAGRPFEMA